MEQINQDIKLLPIIKLNGIEYFVDVARREFRNFRNPDSSVNMHSEEGRCMLKEMTGREWDRFGLSTGAV